MYGCSIGGEFKLMENMNNLRSCRVCGKTLSKKQNKTCSKSCSAKLGNLEIKNKFKSICKLCGKIVSGKRKYCEDCTKEAVRIRYLKRNEELKIYVGPNRPIDEEWIKEYYYNEYLDYIDSGLSHDVTIKKMSEIYELPEFRLVEILKDQDRKFCFVLQ